MARWASLTPLERFEQRITKDARSGCWLWTGAKATGYGLIWNGERYEVVHRWAYKHFKGDIPPGYEIDHLCFKRGCANPQHLDAVTPEENRRRWGVSYRGTKRKPRKRCAQGHKLTHDNIISDPRTGLLRGCKQCRRITALACYYRHKERYLKLKRERRAQISADRKIGHQNQTPS